MAATLFVYVGSDNLQNKQQTKNMWAVLTVSFMSFAGILTETSLNVTFPTMMKDFKVSLDTVQWVTTGYLLMIAIIMICSSYLNERYTAKQLFITSCVGFIVGSLISAFATNFLLMLVGRIISALGAGLCTPLMFNLITEIMPRAKWGLYMGIAGLVIAMAPTLGPGFGGIVTYYLSWRYIFIIGSIFAAVVFLVGIFVIGKYHQPVKKPFDYLSFILLAAAFISLVLGVTQISNGLKNWALWGLLLFSVLFFYLFAQASKRSKRKLLNLDVFKSKAFIYGAIAYFLLQFLNIGSSFVLPNYSQIVSHQSALVGGMILVPGSIIAGLLNPLFGSLYDHYGAKLPLYVGGFLMMLSCLLLAVFGMNLTTAEILIFNGIQMLGHRAAFSNTMAEALKVEPKNLQADATAVCQTSQQMAGSMGTTILASIIAVWQNKGGHSYAFLTAQGSSVAFYFCTILGIIVLVCYWRMFSLEKKTESKK